MDVLIAVLTDALANALTNALANYSPLFQARIPCPSKRLRAIMPPALGAVPNFLLFFAIFEICCHF
jgi:hypothetical protein